MLKKKNFDGKEFTLEELKEFRKQNQTFLNLDKFRKENLAQYELFAIWTEYLLSKELNMNCEFEKRYNTFSSDDKQIINSAINFSKQYGNLATFYEFSLARVQDKKVVKIISRYFWGEIG